MVPGLNRQRTLQSLILAVGVAVASGIGAATPKCSLARLDEWTLKSGHRHPVVEGSLNGHPIGILLDTGSMRSLILSSAARRLDLPLRPARNYRMFGIGGESPVEVARVESFSIGSSVLNGLQLFVSGTQELGQGVDVILGEDFFRSVDVEFDLAHNAVRLFQAKNCDGVSLAYWTTEITGEVAIDAINGSQPQIVVPVKINGRPLEAVLDSGAAASILTKREAAAAGLTPDSPGVVSAGQMTGLGARSVDIWIGPIASFTIGNQTIRDTAMLFGSMFQDATYTETGSHVPRPVEGTAEMFLGVDFLRSHRVLVAHSQRKLYFSYLGGPVFKPGDSVPQCDAGGPPCGEPAKK